MLPPTAQHAQQRLERCRLQMYWNVEWSNEDVGIVMILTFFLIRRVCIVSLYHVISWDVIGYRSSYQLVFIRETINPQRCADEVMEIHILRQLEDQL